MVCLSELFFFEQKTAYEIMPSLVGSEMCIRDRTPPAYASCSARLSSFVFLPSQRPISRGDRTSLVRAHRRPRHHRREFLQEAALWPPPPYPGHRQAPLRLLLSLIHISEPTRLGMISY